MSTPPDHIAEAATGAFIGRVGHKAGGFIAKKFFHPSSLKNQEKLWKAREQKKEQEKEQKELERRRDEEYKIERLRINAYENRGVQEQLNEQKKVGGLLEFDCPKSFIVRGGKEGRDGIARMNKKLKILKDVPSFLEYVEQRIRSKESEKA